MRRLRPVAQTLDLALPIREDREINDRRHEMAKVIHCPCGADVMGETDDELVAAVEQHVQESHPDRVGTMSREEILGAAEEN